MRQVSAAERTLLGIATRQLAYKAAKLGGLGLISSGQMQRVSSEISLLADKLEHVAAPDADMAPPPLILCEADAHLGIPSLDALLGEAVLPPPFGEPRTTAELLEGVEVLGSRFLRRYDKDTSVAANKKVHWQLRFPRISKWAEASDGVVPDTVASFTDKAIAAFANAAAHNGQRVAESARAERGRAAPQSWPALEHKPAAEELEEPMAWSFEGHQTPPKAIERPSWNEATRGAAASPRQPHVPSPHKRAAPPRAAHVEDDYVSMAKKVRKPDATGVMRWYNEHDSPCTTPER